MNVPNKGLNVSDETLSVERRVTVPKIPPEDMMWVSQDHWNHICGRIGRLPRGAEWFNELAFLFGGVSVSTAITAYVVRETTTEIDASVLPTLVVIAVSAAVASLLTFICHKQLQGAERSEAEELQEDMRHGIYSRHNVEESDREDA